MNTKTLMGSVLMLAITLLQSPAQQAPISGQISVNVLGRVNKPARISLPKGATLLDAIASAAGFTEEANRAKVILIHKGSGEKPDSVVVNVKPILSGSARDIALRDGDTVNIGVLLHNF